MYERTTEIEDLFLHKNLFNMLRQWLVMPDIKVKNKMNEMKIPYSKEVVAATVASKCFHKTPREHLLPKRNNINITHRKSQRCNGE